MGLYDQRLYPEEVRAMKAVVEELLKDKATKGVIRNEFRGYVRRAAREQIDQFALWRVLNRPETAPLDRKMLLYDYLVDILAPSVEHDKFLGVATPVAKTMLAALLKLAEKRVRHPWGLHEVALYSATVPKVLKNQFYGYRMSANAASVIRFYIHIQSGRDDTEVTYRNVYRRRDITLNISGTGRFIMETLYLFGHATDVGKNETRGMRVMCLLPIGKEKLCGIILAEDRKQPIAARALLIPVKRHSHAKNWGENRVIRSVVEDMEDHSVSEVVGDLFTHVLDDIKAGKNEPDEVTFARYIDNITPTVVKAGNELTYDPADLIKELRELRDRDREHGPPTETAQRTSESMAHALKAYNMRFKNPDQG